MTNHNHDKVPNQIIKRYSIIQSDVNDAFIDTNATTAIHHVLDLTGPDDTGDQMNNNGRPL